MLFEVIIIYAIIFRICLIQRSSILAFIFLCEVGKSIGRLEGSWRETNFFTTQKMFPKTDQETEVEKLKTKVFDPHANLEDPQWCFVHLFKLYMTLCPSQRCTGSRILFETSKHNYKLLVLLNSHWDTKLSTTVSQLCAAGGIQEHNTSQSLRDTSITRLYNSGVNEQVVIEWTG